MKNHLTRAELWRRIDLAEEDGRAKRPACRLSSHTTVDRDGRVWLCFTCNTHGGAAWRELIAAVAERPDSGIVPAAGTSGDIAHGVSATEEEIAE